MGASGGRVLARVAAAVFSAVLVVASLPARAETPTGTGTATIGLELASLDIEGVTGHLDAGLGSVLLEAGNRDLAHAVVALEGVRAAGETLLARRAEVSGSGQDSGDFGDSVSRRGATASLSALQYLARADGWSASSTISALDAGVTVPPLGARIRLGPDALAAATSATGSVSAVSLTVDGLSLGLADLLPADLFGQIPLGVAIDLVRSIDLPLPPEVEAAVDALEELPEAIDAADDALAEIDAVEDELLALLAGNSAVAAAEDAVDAAAATLASAEATAAALAADVATLTGQISALQAELLTLDPLNPLDALRIAEVTAQITALQAQLATKQAELIAAQAAVVAAEAALAAAEADLAAAIAAASGRAEIDALRAQLAELEQLLAGLVTQLTGLLAGLPDLHELLNDLRDLLAGASLLDLGSIELSLLSESAVDRAAAGVSCTVPSAEVLGRPVSALSCADLAGVVAGVAGALGEALESLGVSPPVAAQGARIAQTATPGSSVSSSSVRIDLLDLSVGAADLGRLVDSLVADLHAQLAGLLGHASIASAESAPVAALQLPSELEALLAGFDADLSALPADFDASALRTTGIAVDLLSLNLGTTFHANRAPGDGGSGDGGSGGGGPGNGSGGIPGTATPGGGTPGSVPGAGDGPGGELPRTGGGVVLAAAGLWFAVTGRLLLFSARRAPSPPR